MEPSETSTRELTLEEAVSVAILLQKNGSSPRPSEVYRRVLETAPDHPRALHYAGVLAHQQGRNDEALALIERSLALAPDQADWCSNLGIVLQSDGRLDAAIAVVPARDRHRSGPRQRSQQSGRAAAGDRTADRGGSRVSRSHPAGSRTHRRLHQPGHSAQRAAAHRGSRGVLLQGDHAAPEAPRSAQAAGAGALHAGRDRRGGDHLRGVARGRAGGSDRAAHAGRVHRSRRARARVERFRRRAPSTVSPSSFEAKLETLSYRAPALVAAMLEDCGLEPFAAPRRAGRGLRHRALRPAGRAVCAPVDRRGPLRRDAGARQG